LSPLYPAPYFDGATLSLFPCTPSQLVDNLRGRVPRDTFKTLKSAVRVTCKKAHRDPDKWVLASAQELVDQIRDMHPLQIGMKPSYWRVTSSRVMNVLSQNGVHLLSGHCKTVLSDEWASLVALARLLDEPRTRSLMPFIRDRMAAGRRPHQITQTDYDAYCGNVDMFSQRKNKKGSKLAARSDWNFFARRIPEWPKANFRLQEPRDEYILAKADMPQAVAEFDARATEALRGNRKYAKRRRRLSAETIKSRKYTFRRIVSAAVAAGISRERLMIADVCDPEVLEAAYNYILDSVEEKRKRKGECTKRVEGTCDVSRLAGFMFAIAEQWVGVKGAALEEHVQMREDFEHIQQGMAIKNQKLLAKFQSDRAIADFLRTPARVMASFDNVTDLSVHDCVEMQMAAAMALFTRVLVRMENMKRILVGTHLTENHGVERKVLLIFSPEEVKNEEYLETLLSPRIVAVLDTYMQRAWPKLRRGASKALFPGYGGKHKGASCFGRQLSNFVKRHTGIAVSPHQFRHLGGYFHLKRFPGDYATVQKMLGHRRIETTIKFYTGTMDRKAAFEKYDTDLDARIDEAEANERNNAKVRVK
jgi:integrase